MMRLGGFLCVLLCLLLCVSLLCVAAAVPCGYLVMPLYVCCTLL